MKSGGKSLWERGSNLGFLDGTRGFLIAVLQLDPPNPKTIQIKAGLLFNKKKQQPKEGRQNKTGRAHDRNGGTWPARASEQFLSNLCRPISFSLFEALRLLLSLLSPDQCHQRLG
jgi:hypothetical protein